MHSNNNDVHNQFLISKERISELVVEIHHKNPAELSLETIVSALKTDLNTGILGDQTDLLSRRKHFGSNSSLPPRQKTPFKRLKHLLSEATRDTTIILLVCCGLVSLAIGVVKNGPHEGLIDGAMVFLAISLAVAFGAIFSFVKSFKHMNRKVLIKHHWVVRNGISQKIPETEVVVGDILWLQTGDRVPADGILFIDADSYNLVINDGLEQKQYGSNHSSVFSGAKVVRGQARMLVTCVGENTERGHLFESLKGDEEEVKLRFLDEFDKKNSKLEKVSLSLTLVLLAVQLARCFGSKSGTRADHMDHKGVKNTLEDLFIESIKLMKKERSKASGLVTILCILVFATRDGLPLAVFTMMLYASRKMKSCFGSTIQKLPAGAMIGSVTTICLSSTADDLVLRHERMAELWVDFELIIIDHGVYGKLVDSEILDLLREGIFMHCSGHEGREDVSLLCWSKAVLGDYCSISPRYEARDDVHNLSCVVIKRESRITEAADEVLLHVHWKGDPKLILLMCSHYYNANGAIETLDNNTRTIFVSKIDCFAACGLCCFAFAFKREITKKETPKSLKKTFEQDLIFLGLVGLKNPYKPELREAIEKIQKSQKIDIKLMSDDDITTARIMALNCGLLNDDNISEGGAIIIEASHFRSISDEERMNIIDNIKVMSNSTPSDKLLLVQCLRKRKGEIVAASVSSIRDSPVLKEADVGIFMGDRSVEVSNCDIVVESLSKIPGIVDLGRRVCESVEKFLVVQLTLEITGFAVNFLNAFLAVTSTGELISSFQILWTILIMEVVGAIAVAITTIHTDDDVIVTNAHKTSNIVVHSLFQVTVILIMGMMGRDVFRVDDGTLRTMIFNCYGLCQVFVLLLTGIEVKKMKNIKRWLMFVGVVGIIGIVQVPLVEIMAVLAGWATLDVEQWWICVGIASFAASLSCAPNWILKAVTSLRR